MPIFASTWKLGGFERVNLGKSDVDELYRGDSVGTPQV
jgi:hypothetical protein